MISEDLYGVFEKVLDKIELKINFFKFKNLKKQKKTKKTPCLKDKKL